LDGSFKSGVTYWSTRYREVAIGTNVIMEVYGKIFGSL
jgi:hypothetical protein